MNNNIYNKIIDLIFHSVISEGGDGDAVWLSKHTSITELFELINTYNLKNNTGWDIIKHENYLEWGIDQEFVLITNDIEFFDSQPSWITMIINY